ncbi:MAG: hypothetical protein ABEJ89_06865 [Haloarculaceae archaeon]
MAGTFHVVCHDCTLEGVYEERGDAVDARDRHEAETEHRVSCADIGRSAATPNP